MLGEVITVQLGDYANYVGAHLWNLQDEAVTRSEQEGWREVCATVDHNVLTAWAEDPHPGGPAITTTNSRPLCSTLTCHQGTFSYCPRAVVVDFSGALGGLKISQTGGDDSSVAAATWQGRVEVHAFDEVTKSQYRKQLEAGDSVDPGNEAAVAAYQQELEAAADALQGEPKYWTDYLQVDFHPSCVLTVPGVWRSLGSWDGWGPPIDNSNSRETAEAAVDKVRWWAEKCDHLQGLQLLAEDVGGWGSQALGIVTELREQYQGLPMLYYSLQKPQVDASQASSVRRSLSQSISVAELSQLVSLYVPLSPPASQLKVSHGAACLAAAIDTVTLPFRCTGMFGYGLPGAASASMKKSAKGVVLLTGANTAAGAVLGATDMHSLVQLLTQQGRNLAALSFHMPVGQIKSVAGVSSSSGFVLDPNSGFCDVLTPGVKLAAQDTIAELATLRGARAGHGLASTTSCKTALEALLQQQSNGRHGPLPCMRHTCISPMPVALPVFFPSGCTGDQAVPLSLQSLPGWQAPILSARGQLARPAPGAMTRLTATFGFRELLHVGVSRLVSIAGSAFGRCCLEQWGYSGSDAGELQESLQYILDQYSSQEA